MSMWKRFTNRITGRADEDLDREIRAHLELEEEEQQQAGLASKDARHAARRRFGNVTATGEAVRLEWSWSPAERIWREVRQAVRMLSRKPGFTLTALATLAVAIALNTTALAVVNAYLWTSLPYPEARRLYNVRYSLPSQPHPEDLEKLDWKTLDDVIEHFIAWDLDMFYLVGGGSAESAPGAWVTPGFVQGLGLHVALGRIFSPDEFRPGSPQVALISHALWQRRFGGDPAVVGRHFEAYMSDRPDEAELFTIIGVLPADFWHMNRYTEVLAPLRAPSYPYMVRLREGVPPAEAERRISELVRSRSVPLPEGWQAQVRSTHSEYAARVRPLVLAIIAATGLVLLIACANVAFLLLIRATRRRREIAVRMALGAGRGRIAWMLIVEALLLAGAATSAGIALSRVSLDSLAAVFERQLGRLAPGGASAISVGGAVLAVAAGCGILITLLFALTPLFPLRRDNLAQAMHGGHRTGTEGAGARRVRSALVGAEVAASLALLAACGLMLQTVMRLLRVDFGYRAEAVLTAQLGLRQNHYPEAAMQSAYYQRLLSALSQTPGVRAAALGDGWVLQPARLRPIEAEAGGTLLKREAGVHRVSAGYFATLGVPLAQGREFSTSDGIGAEPVAIVSQSLARALWPGESATGRRILPANREMGGEQQAAAWHTVVGVAADVRQSPTDEDLADLYVPLLQSPTRFAALYVATAGPAAGASLAPVRQALAEIDPEVSLDQAGPLQALLDDQLSRSRFLASLLGGFALFAALLALLGVYGVVAYSVRQREHEIAVRMAVGADAPAVTNLFLRQGARVLAAGIAAGLAGAVALGGMLETQLYGVGSHDPATLVAASLAFAAAGLVATWWPARRAARVDPMVALRNE